MDLFSAVRATPDSLFMGIPTGNHMPCFMTCSMRVATGSGVELPMRLQGLPHGKVVSSNQFRITFSSTSLKTFFCLCFLLLCMSVSLYAYMSVEEATVNENFVRETNLVPPSYFALVRTHCIASEPCRPACRSVEDHRERHRSEGILFALLKRYHQLW